MKKRDRLHRLLDNQRRAADLFLLADRYEEMAERSERNASGRSVDDPVGLILNALTPPATTPEEEQLGTLLDVWVRSGGRASAVLDAVRLALTQARLGDLAGMRSAMAKDLKAALGAFTAIRKASSSLARIAGGEWGSFLFPADANLAAAMKNIEAAAAEHEERLRRTAEESEGNQQGRPARAWKQFLRGSLAVAEVDSPTCDLLVSLVERRAEAVRSVALPSDVAVRLPARSEKKHP